MWSLIYCLKINLVFWFSQLHNATASRAHLYVKVSRSIETVFKNQYFLLLLFQNSGVFRRDSRNAIDTLMGLSGYPGSEVLFNEVAMAAAFSSPNSTKPQLQGFNFTKQKIE